MADGHVERELLSRFLRAEARSAALFGSPLKTSSSARSIERRTREQCYPILKSWGLHSDALAAWLVFRDSLRNRRLDSVFSRMREYFRRHWVKPAALDS